LAGEIFQPWRLPEKVRARRRRESTEGKYYHKDTENTELGNGK
jgi:hypothetical protein